MNACSEDLSEFSVNFAKMIFVFVAGKRNGSIVSSKGVPFMGVFVRRTYANVSFPTFLVCIREIGKRYERVRSHLVISCIV